MKIAHVSRAAETLWWLMVPTMKEQQRHGHEVMICTEGPHAEKLRELGFQVFTHGMKRSINPLMALRTIWRIRRILRTQRADAVVCYNKLGGVVGRLGAWLAGVPRVGYFAQGLACGPAQSAVDYQMRYQVERFLAPITDAIFVLNGYDEKLLRTKLLVKRPAGVCRIRSTGVDVSRFVPGVYPEIRAKLAKELGVDSAHAFVLCAARLIPDKGVLDFVEAAKRVCVTRRDVVFLLGGTGPLLETLRHQVAAAGLDAHVKVLGWRNDMADLMKSADMFVLPSYYMEGLPVSILEAMACGKPVVTTHHKGCEDAVVEGETAFLVPVKHPAQLAEKILTLLADPSLRERMGVAGRRRVETRFEIGDCTREVAETMERVLARP